MSDMNDNSEKHRILIVDDNIDNTDSLAMLLNCWDLDIRAVNSGVAALEILDSFKPHTILLDIGMPTMNGHEVAKRIRQQPKYDHIKLIALTGWGQDTDREESKASGFDEHLTKPVNITLLSELLKI